MFAAGTFGSTAAVARTGFTSQAAARQIKAALAQYAFLPQKISDIQKGEYPPFLINFVNTNLNKF
jgi:hypothetical protein